MKYLGIDYGTKRIGVAHSDENGSVAFPLTTVEAGPKALAEVVELVKKNGAAKIVIGESRNFKNEPNLLMEDIELFKKDLAELTGLEVVYEPEFLTTAQASRVGQDKRGTGRGEKNDASAAALILQGYLDKMGSHE